MEKLIKIIGLRQIIFVLNIFFCISVSFYYRHHVTSFIFFFFFVVRKRIFLSCSFRGSWNFKYFVYLLFFTKKNICDKKKVKKNLKVGNSWKWKFSHCSSLSFCFLLLFIPFLCSMYTELWIQFTILIQKAYCRNRWEGTRMFYCYRTCYCTTYTLLALFEMQILFLKISLGNFKL